MIRENATFQLPPNTFKNTFCVFTEVNVSNLQDRSPDFESDSGSKYYYTEQGMYRLSNHWGRLGNSKWRLIENGDTSASKVKLGYANWEDFFPDNKYEALYYVTVDFETRTVLYQHKLSKNYDDMAVVRTSDDTMKRVRQARNILHLTNWAKHFPDWEIEVLRKKIVTDLIYTNKTLDEIKRQYA
ncbi:hypothetical protein ACS8MM_01115 [Flavobacterium sp. MAHUQ-57]